MGLTTVLYIHLNVLFESPHNPHRSHCSFALHECSGRFLFDVVNVCVVVKLAIESYTKGLHREIVFPPTLMGRIVQFLNSR